jgi:hypothetical protein
MFIDTQDLKILRSSGAKCIVRCIHLAVHCAPLERHPLVAENYKHLAPLEPQHGLVSGSPSYPVRYS